jgi:predicted transcriptional regulator
MIGNTPTMLVALLLLLGPMFQGIEVGPVEHPDEFDEKSLDETGLLFSPRGHDLLSNVGGYFTENLGQYGEGAGSFYCMGDPLSVSMGSGWVAYYHEPSDGAEGVMVKVDFGEEGLIEPIGRMPLSYPTNFLMGNDPSKWVVAARSYREVVYVGIYEGIDLVYRFEEGKLKYDFMVEPFADISQIQMRYHGHDDLSIDGANGDLVIGTSVVNLVDMAPVAFQERQAKEDLVSRYVLLDEGTVSFEVDGHDPSLPLVIDPGLDFSTYLGGNNVEGTASAVDENGNVYLGGHTSSTNFPTTAGVISKDHKGIRDAFVCKLKADGSDLIFSTFIGTSEDDAGLGIALDDAKNIVLAGVTLGTDFPTTSGAFQTKLKGRGDAFVLKLNHNGSRIIFSTLLGGSDTEVESALEPAMMSNGDVMVVGITDSSDFPGVTGCYDPSANGGIDTFAARVNHNGTQLLKATYLGGDGMDFCWWKPLEVDEQDEVYIAYATDSTDIQTSQDAFQRVNKGYNDTALIKLDGNLTEMRYSTYLGGSDHDGPSSLEVDDSGCAYVVGWTWSLRYPTTPGAYDVTYDWSQHMEGFITKMKPDGSAPEFSTYFGNEGEESLIDVSLGDNGFVYFTMFSNSTRLPTTEFAYSDTNNGKWDTYLGVLDGENQTIRYGTFIGGSEDEGDTAMVHVQGNKVTIADHTWSADYPVTPGAFQRQSTFNGDLVVARFDVALSDPHLSSPPVNLTARLVDATVELEWSPPLDKGGYNLWGYWLFRGEANGTMTRLRELGPLATNHTDPPPELGKTYYYNISAFSPAGESGRSNTVNVTFVLPPGPPTGLEAEAGCGTVRLHWTSPAFTGGLPVGFHVFKGTTSTNTEHLISLGAVEEFTDDAVVSGQTYYYKVAAFNSMGNSSFTPVVQAFPMGPPDMPLNTIATPGDMSIELRWEPPYNDGGRAISGYEILRGFDPVSLSSLVILNGTTQSFIDGSLQTGVTYFYAVRAINELGTGPMGLIVNATPTGPPGIPFTFEVIAGDGHVRLSWESPVDDGGSPILGFTIHRGLSRAQLVTLAHVDGANQTFNDTGLMNGQALFYAVSAFNLVGDGPRTSVIEATPQGLPDAPGNVVAWAGHGVVHLTWLRPNRDGGSDVTHYAIYRGTAPEELEPLVTLDQSRLSYDDTDVSLGTTYHYAVAAVTAVGEGPLSGSVSGTPFTVPSAPTDLEVDYDNGAVVLSWTLPGDDGGNAIGSYRVYRGTDPSLMALLVEVPFETQLVDSNVVPGTTYYYVVSALNEAGEGAWTQAMAAYPALPIKTPGPPHSLKGSVDGEVVVLTWFPPLDIGGSPVSGYVIFRGPSGNDLREVARVGDVLMYRDKGRDADRTYHYAVTAENSFGTGELSEVVQVHIEASDVVLPPLTPLLLFVIVIVVIFGILLGASLASEPFKYSMTLLLLPLFTRFTRDQVLDNKNRHAIHGLIIDNPGIHFNAIIKEYNLPLGVATYHLDVLEREEFIQSVRDGRRKCFYTTDTKIPNGGLRKTPEEIRKTVMVLVKERPGISQKQLIRELGVDRKTLGYHISMLLREDMLRSSKQGRFTVYHPNKRK